MALTRAFMAGLGLTAEQQSAIIEAHAETVEAPKGQRDQYKQAAEENQTAAAELESLKAEAEKNSSWKEKHDKIAAEYEAYKAEQTGKETKAAKTEAYKDILKAAGVSDKRMDAILKVTDLEAIELDKDGKCKNAEKLTESVKTEWSDFIVATNTQGAQTQTPPAGSEQAPNYESMTMEEYVAARNKK